MSAWDRLIVRSRPRFWLYLAGPVLVGLAYGADSIGEVFSPIGLLLFAFFLVPANVFLYGINDIFDAEIDRRNPKKDNREARYRGDRLTRIAVTLSGALGLGILVFVPTAAIPWIVGFLVLGAAYSAPPLRLKTRPPLDSVSNGLYILPGVAGYVAVAGVLPPILAIVGAWFWAMAMHTFSAIPDIRPDREAGIRTLATELGKRGTLVYCGVTWLVATLAFGVLSPLAGGLMAVYPALVAAIWIADLPVDRAYWWFPGINAMAGMVLTLGGLWGLLYG
jgi:4-hydroxybenzoate polyprenyltransferase